MGFPGAKFGKIAQTAVSLGIPIAAEAGKVENIHIVTNVNIYSPAARMETFRT